MRPSRMRFKKRRRRRRRNRTEGDEEGDDDDDDFDDDDDNDDDDDDEAEMEVVPEEKKGDEAGLAEEAKPTATAEEAAAPPPDAQKPDSKEDATVTQEKQDDALVDSNAPMKNEKEPGAEPDKEGALPKTFSTPETVKAGEKKGSMTDDSKEKLGKEDDGRFGIGDKDESKYGSQNKSDMYEDESEEYVEEPEDEVPPPPPGEEKELLFLIEFMVDTMTIFPENLNTDGIDPCALMGATSIILTFLHFPPMEINEKDVDPDKQTGFNVIQFKMGKSLMFALTESQFESPPSVFLAVTATKDMPHAYRFPKMLIGKTKIQLSELFKQAFDKYDEESDKKTVSKSIKDKFELIGENNKTAAEVSIYIRLTCVGENLVTEFQKKDEEDDTLFFRNEESRRMYECKTSQKPVVSPATIVPEWGSNAKKKDVWEKKNKKESPPDPEDEDFEEIFAEINGSSIKVKVEKSKRKDAQKIYHVSDFCDCDIPLPSDLVAGLSDVSLPQGSESSLQFDRSVKPIKPDPRVGLDPANQLIFQIPPAETLAQVGMKNDITYNVKTCRDCERHGHSENNYYRITKDGTYDGSPPKMPNDSDKDVFILRIIKRGKNDKGKDVLNLEFKTPKEKIEQPRRPPYMKDMAIGQEKKSKKTKKDKKKKK